MGKHGRLVGLLHLGAADLDFTKFIVENSNLVKLEVEDCSKVGYCLTEEEVANVQVALAENKKPTSEYLAYMIERLAMCFNDGAVASAVTNVSSKKAMKKKKLISLLRSVENVDDARSVQLLKACSKEFATVSQQYMAAELHAIASLKHSKNHAVVIRCEEPGDDGAVRGRVVHIFESSAKLFQLHWQVVVDLDWSRGGSMSAKNIGIYITKLTYKTKEGIEGEQAEALAAVMVNHKVPRSASVRRSRRPSSAPARNAVSPLVPSTNAETIAEGDVTAASDDGTPFPSDDEIFELSEDNESEGEDDEEEQDVVHATTNQSSSFRANRLSRFLPQDGSYKTGLIAAVEAARAETCARSDSIGCGSLPRVRELSLEPFPSTPKHVAPPIPKAISPVSPPKPSPLPAKSSSMPLSKFNAGIQSMMMSPSCSVSLARPAEPGEAVPTPQMMVSESTAPKTANVYSSPLLLPGEIVVQDNIINDVKHKYGENVIGRKDKMQASSKKHKWFGATRIKAAAGGGNKPKKKQSKAVLGRIIVTNFQLIFVPVASGPEHSFHDHTPKKSPSDAKSDGFSSPLSKYMGARRAKASSMFLRSNHRSAGSDDIIHHAVDDSSVVGKNPMRESAPNPAVDWKPAKNEDDAEVAPSSAPSPGVYNVEEHVYVPFLDIYRVDVVNRSKVGGSKTVEISCKDFRTLYFSFSSATMDANQFVTRMKIYFPTKELDMFAFRFADSKRKIEDDGVNGWKIFKPRKELERILCKDPAWRITDTNLQFGLCDTYLRVLAVPATITDEQLHKVKEFRSRSRLPALSWRHPETKASLTRCSQPKVGMTGARCVEDEQLLWEIMLVNQDRSAATAKKISALPLYLMDARPRANAMANHAVGAGFEDTSRYKNAKLRFLNIPNIHVMRDSLRKLHELCLPHSSVGGAGFLSALESTHWLEYIHLLIVSAVRICNLMNAGINVLIHCSDGWDRTSQLSALVMLLMDPYYRTLEGFIVLVEKEWLGYGHKFRDRCGHIHPWTESETSPIFLQFIDAVWQITEQFPGEFEFNTRFLILMLDQINSGQFGTFLCNSVKERAELKLPEDTVSVWTHVMENVRFYTHAHFYGYQFGGAIKSARSTCQWSFLRPSTEMKSIKFFSDYYLRFDRSVPSAVLLREADLWAWAHVSHLETATREFAEYKAGVDSLLAQEEEELSKTRAALDVALTELNAFKDIGKSEGSEKTANVELNYEKLVARRLRADLTAAKAEIAQLQAALAAANIDTPAPSSAV